MEFGFSQISNFAAYGTDRLSLSETFQLSNDKSRLNSLFGFKQEGLQNIEEYLISIKRKNQVKFNVIISVFKTLIVGLYDIVIDESSTKDKVYYIEKDSENRPMKQVDFSQLATGYKNIIALIGDMIIQLGDQADVVTIDGADTLDIQGIVIIDEIDAHLHPKYQKNFAAALTGLFPKVQFIASTHSPIPLLGAPYNTVILNVSKESAKEGIKVERLDDKIDFKNLTPQVILTSPIFGFDEIIPDSIPDLRKLRTEDSYNEVVFNQILEQKLNQIDSSVIEKMEKLFE